MSVLGNLGGHVVADLGVKAGDEHETRTMRLARMADNSLYRANYEGTHDSFMMLAIFSSLAWRPTTRFFSNERMPSERILMLWSKFLIIRGL